jgi:phosphoribosylformylglycinamidine (FGAM) synthase-like enzyme
MDALREAMKTGSIASCHDVSEGGLAVAVCEMLLGGDIGAALDITPVNPGIRNDYALFSESNSRWVVEVWSDEAKTFEASMKTRGVSLRNLGETVAEKRIDIRDGERALVNLSLEEVRKAWLGTIG